MRELLATESGRRHAAAAPLVLSTSALPHPLQLKHEKGVRREGRDLHSPLAVSLWDALLGGPAVVQTLRGSATLHVPPGGGLHNQPRKLCCASF